MQDDIYQLYLEELAQIAPCNEEEEAALLVRLLSGDRQARERLTEGSLPLAAEYAKEYQDRGLSVEDLMQEAGLALVMAVDAYRDGDFREQL